MLASLARISAAPLALTAGQSIIEIDAIRKRKGDPAPADDGLIRDSKGVVIPDQVGRPGWNAGWVDEFLTRWKAEEADEGFEFAELLAGALHKRTIDDITDNDAMVQRQLAIKEIEDARKAELEQLRKSVDERIKDLRGAQAYVEELQAARVAEQSGVAGPAQRWLTEGGLGSLLRLTGPDSLLFPFYMRWQYEFFQQRIGGVAPPRVDPITAEDIKRIRFILATDARILLHVPLANDLRNRIDKDLLTINLIAGAPELRNNVRIYVVYRDISWLRDGNAFHSDLARTIVMPDLIATELATSLQRGYSHLPGVTPYAASLSNLREEHGLVVSPTIAANSLTFNWHDTHAPVFFSPYHWPTGAPGQTLPTYGLVVESPADRLAQVFGYPRNTNWPRRHYYGCGGHSPPGPERHENCATRRR